MRAEEDEGARTVPPRAPQAPAHCITHRTHAAKVGTPSTPSRLLPPPPVTSAVSGNGKDGCCAGTPAVFLQMPLDAKSKISQDSDTQTCAVPIVLFKFPAIILSQNHRII